jgi:hypothetical protein
MSCVCQECGADYKIDLTVPDNVWEKIKPNGKPKGSGLLCGQCIMEKLERFFGYGVIYGDGDAFQVSDKN